MIRTYTHSVLIVDDDADDRESVRDAFLENKHHQNYIFIEDGSQLLDFLNKNEKGMRPSLIMLDLNMPGKDGRDTLKEIKSNKNFHHIPVVVFTTSASMTDMEISYSLGANCFITKPNTYSKLIDITNSIAKLWLVYPPYPPYN